MRHIWNCDCPMAPDCREPAPRPVGLVTRERALEIIEELRAYLEDRGHARP